MEAFRGIVYQYGQVETANKKQEYFDHKLYELNSLTLQKANRKIDMMLRISFWPHIQNKIG